MDFTEESRKNVNLTDQMQIEDGTGIGNNDAFHNPSRSRVARSRARSCSSYSIQT